MINIQKLYNNPNLKIKFETLPQNNLLWNDLYLNFELSSITELTEEEQSEILKKISMDRERIEKFNSLIRSEKKRLGEISTQLSSDEPSISKMPETLIPKFKSFKRV